MNWILFQIKHWVLIKHPCIDGQWRHLSNNCLLPIRSNDIIQTNPKIRMFDYPAVIDFSEKLEVLVMAPNHGGNHLGSILGPMGSHWVQKMGQNRKNYHAQKFAFFTTPPRSSIFRKNWKLLLWHQITVGTPYGPSCGQWGPIGTKTWAKP